jgi:hypothetical protein
MSDLPPLKTAIGYPKEDGCSRTLKIRSEELWTTLTKAAYKEKKQKYEAYIKAGEDLESIDDDVVLDAAAPILIFDDDGVLIWDKIPLEQRDELMKQFQEQELDAQMNCVISGGGKSKSRRRRKNKSRRRSKNKSRRRRKSKNKSRRKSKNKSRRGKRHSFIKRNRGNKTLKKMGKFRGRYI